MERKPVSGEVALVELLAKEVVEVLEAFPPAEDTVDWTDASFAARYRGRLASFPRLDSQFVGQLFELVRLDLEHDTDRIEWLLRNDHHRPACPTAAHVDALMLLWPTLLEHLYARKDDCQGILKRSHLVQICVEAEQRFRTRALGRA
jgi:hypothetical protein